MEKKKRRFLNRWGIALLALCLICLIVFSYATVMASQSPAIERPFDIYYEQKNYTVENNFYHDSYLSEYDIQARDFSEKALIKAIGIGVGAENYDGRGVTLEEGWNSKYNPVISAGVSTTEVNLKNVEVRNFKNGAIDPLLEVGFIFKTVTQEEYSKIVAWQEETGLRVLYPLLNEENTADAKDANLWYKNKKYDPLCTNEDGELKKQELSADMVLEDNYMRDADGNVLYWRYCGGDSIETVLIRIRVLYYNYYQYMHAFDPHTAYGQNNGETLEQYRQTATYAAVASVMFALLFVVNIFASKHTKKLAAQEELPNTCPLCGSSIAEECTFCNMCGTKFVQKEQPKKQHYG